MVVCAVWALLSVGSHVWTSRTPLLPATPMSAIPSHTTFLAVYNTGLHGQAPSRSDSARLRGRIVIRASAPEGWDEAKRPQPELPVGDTLPQAFLHNSQRMGSAIAAADDISGVLNYGTYLIGVLLFADFIRDNPRYVKGGRIGVMIPASAGFGVVAMGVLLAGCSLVMINWTAGRANIQHMIAVSGITTVLTSKKFMERLLTCPFCKNVICCFTPTT